MGKFTTRLPLDIKTGDPKNNHIPIYDQTRGVWNTVASSSLIVSSSVSASFATTASYVAGNVLSSSFATTASYVAGTVLSSSYALTSSYAENTNVFPFTGSADISGSLSVRTNNVFISGANEPVLTIRGNYPTINLLGLAGAGNSGSIYMNGSEVRVGGMGANTNLVFMAGGSPTWYIDSTNGDDLIPTLNDFSVYPNIGATTTRVKTIFTTNINSTNPISSSVSASYATTSSFATTASYVAGIVLSASYAATSSTATSASYALTASAATSITFTPPTASYALTSSIATSASYALTASAATSITFTPPTASFAITASYVNGTVLSSSYALTSSFSTTASAATSITFTPPTASYALTSSIAASASYALTASAATSITFTPPTASYALTSSIAASASYALTASFSITASTATSITFTPPTASYALTSSIATSASYALTSSYANRATTIFPFSGSAVITGSLTLISGSINVISGSVTASLFGTASVAISSSFTTTASYAVSSSFSTTASAATSITFTPPTASYALTSSIATSASYALTSSFATTASTATSITFTPPTASYALTSSIATSASYAITSSHSNRATTIFPFSGSAIITGSLTILSGSINIISGSVTGSLFGTASTAVSSSFATTASYVAATSVVGNVTSASYALTSSFATTASYVAATSVVGNVTSASYALTASFATTASLATSNILTASVNVNTITFTKGDGTQFNIQVSQDGTATSAISASYVDIQASSPGGPFYIPFVDTATGYRKLQSDTDLTYNSSTNILNTTSSYALTSSIAISASYASTASFATTASAATSITFAVNTGSFTGSFIGTHSGSTFGTSSWAVSASNATTASYVAAGSVGGTVISASYAATASYIEFLNVANKPTLVSSSIQIDHNATTNYSANRHIDHTAVSITAGAGLTGGGDISSTRTLTALYIPSTDARAVNNPPASASAGLYADFKTNTTDGLVDGGSYHGVLTFRPYGSTSDFSGGPAYQEGFTENGNLYLRSGSLNTWSSWRKLAYETGSILGSSSFATTASYVAAGNVGGTVTSASYAATSSNLIGGATNYIPLWTSATAQSSSNIYQSTGNIGIGITNPAVKLEVGVPGTSDASIIAGIFGKTGGNAYGSTVLRVARYTGTTDLTVTTAVEALDLEYNSGGSGPFRYGTFADAVISNEGGATNGPYGAIHFATSGSIRMTVGGGTLAGNVGIGTTSPSYLLDVRANVAAAATPSVTLRLNNQLDGGHRILFSNAAAATLAAIDGDIESSGAGTDDGVLKFWTATNGSMTEKVRIDKSGNVGIGTTSPGARLHVQGNVSASTYTSSISNGVGYFGTASYAVTASYVAAGSVGGTVLSASYAATASNLTGGTANYIPLWSTATLQASSVIYQNASNIGIGTTSPTSKLQVAGGISRTNTRVSDSEVYPVGHYTPGETVFEINTTWTDAELRQYFNSANVAWTSSADAPGGYAIYINDAVNVGGEYNSGFPYIPVDQDDVFYMECWIKNIGSSQAHYMGSMEYNHLLSSIGGNPGTYGYWVMSNTNPTTAWTKVSGYIKGFGTSTGQFVVGAKYWTPQALFNFTAGTGTRACVISGWKVIKVNAMGNRFFSGSVGIGTTSLSNKLQVQGNVSASSYTSSISNGVGYFGTASYAVNADLLDGIDSSNFVQTTTAQNITGVKTFYSPSNTFINTVGPANYSATIYQDTAAADAYMTFHVNGDYAGYFGLGGAENDLVWGGWSYGNVRHRIWHSGNDGASSGLDADLLDGYNSATAATANTIALRDNNGDLTNRYNFSSYHNSTDDISVGTISHIMAKFGDNYYRSATAAKVASFISGQTMNIVGTATSASYTTYAETSTVPPPLRPFFAQTLGGF